MENISNDTDINTAIKPYNSKIFLYLERVHRLYFMENCGNYLVISYQNATKIYKLLAAS